MSNKIDGGMSSVPRVVSHPSAGVERAGNERSQPVGPAPAADQVRLTSEATALQAMARQLGAESAFDHAKVESVRSALEKGNYSINADAIASALLHMEQDLG